MILYFSGTGNSEYVAKRIAAETKEEVFNLFEKIRNHDFTRMHSEGPWVIVTPTYAWRIPRILQEWLEKTELTGSKAIYFVMTCGGNIGNAGKYLKQFCAFKKMDYKGCFPVVMPENYIAMFPVPTKEEALNIIGKAENEIDKAISFVKKSKSFPESSLTLTDRMNSSIVNFAFYPLFVHAKKFTVNAKCISCGKCAKACPMNNIHIEDGKPVWGKNCTHCMACICKCPTEAIEYGNHSKGQPRYTCPK